MNTFDSESYINLESNISGSPISNEREKLTCDPENILVKRTSLLTKETIGNILTDTFNLNLNLLVDSEIYNAIENLPEITVSLLSDETVFSINNNGDMASDTYIGYLIEVAEQIGQKLHKGSKFSNLCKTKSDCFFKYIAPLAKKLWRRSLTKDEFDSLELIIENETSLKEGFVISMISILSSPQFYLINYESYGKGNMSAQAKNYELVSRLSFFLYDSAPDEELLKLAEKDDMNLLELSNEVDRILANPVYLDRFVRNTLSEWLGIKEQLSSNEVYENSSGNEVSVAALARPLFMKLRDIVKENKNISEIFNSDSYYTNNELRKFAGTSEANLTDEFSLEQGQGSYFISSHFSFLTRNTSDVDKTVITNRGMYVIKKFYCISTPVNEVSESVINSALGEGHAHMKQIDIAKIRIEKNACAVCHRYSDRIGMALESIGPFGKERAKYSDGTPISYSFNWGESKVNNLDDFLSSSATDERIQSCFLKTITSKISHLVRTSPQPCIPQDIIKSNIGIRDQIKQLLVSPHFVRISTEVK